MDEVASESAAGAPLREPLPPDDTFRFFGGVAGLFACIGAAIPLSTGLRRLSPK